MKIHFSFLAVPTVFKLKWWQPWRHSNSSNQRLLLCRIWPSAQICCCTAESLRPVYEYNVSLCLYVSTPAIHVPVSPQVFSNCSCVGVTGNFTASTGQCLHTDDCDRMFPYFLALSVITSFIISLGGTPGYMILIRSDIKLKKPNEKKEL